ncbi:50S ribosomal protein L6 [Chloroflexota bacterium]
MSRVGNRPITVPQGVEVSIHKNEVTVTGPKGELYRSLPKDMIITLDNSILTVSRPTDNRIHRSLHGLTRTLLANMVEGVSTGFQKSLELQGVGYRAQKPEEKLIIQVGYSHPVEITPPEGITLVCESPNKINVLGYDKELVGRVAAQIRSVRPPEPYRGKGIRYAGEQIRRKAGKAGKIGKKA